MTVDLAKLIERLEAATGPDRELDRDILAATRGLRVIDESLCEMDNWYYRVDGDEEIPAYPSPTGSIDAAMTLVPEGWSKSVSLGETGQHAQAVLGRSYPTNKSVYQEARTMPIALCIAALKARSLNSPGGA